MVTTFFPSSPSSSLCSSSSSSPRTLLPGLRTNGKRPPSSSSAVVCRAADHAGRRSINICLTTLGLSLASNNLLSHHYMANAAVLEADDDLELLERVKQDRKKRLQKQEVISSSKKETAYLQELVYKLSKVGQAIDNSDFSAATSILGPNLNADWVQNVNLAFTKLSSSPEEMTEVNTFNTSIASLITSVTKKDAESCKKAFVSSASALEKWTTLTGLGAQLKGL